MLRILPSSVHSAISTAAEASRTTTGSSDLAELASYGQVLSDPLLQVARGRTTHTVHPCSRVELPRGAPGLRQDHDALGGVV